MAPHDCFKAHESAGYVGKACTSQTELLDMDVANDEDDSKCGFQCAFTCQADNSTEVHMYGLALAVAYISQDNFIGKTHDENLN